MPRFLVERTFPDRFSMPEGDAGTRLRDGIVDSNAASKVTWIHSYVSDDRTKTFCIYEASSPDDIRTAAEALGLPCDKVTEVSSLDPYAF